MVLFKPIYICIYITVCVGKSTFVLLTLLIPALGSPFSNRFAGVLGSYYRMNVRWPTEWLTFAAKPLSTGSLRKFQGSEQDVSVCVLWWTLSGSTAIKEAVFCNFKLAYLPCSLHPPPLCSSLFTKKHVQWPKWICLLVTNVLISGDIWEADTRRQVYNLSSSSWSLCWVGTLFTFERTAHKNKYF
jgi:hypothetical protein